MPIASSLYRLGNKGSCRYFLGQSANAASAKSLADSSGVFFIHVPKAAGMSVSSALYSGSQIGHWRAEEILYILGSLSFSSYKYITVVRNPFDRLYSAYRFLKRGGITPLDFLFSELRSDLFESFTPFVKHLHSSSLLRAQLHFVSQFDFVSIGKSLCHLSVIGHAEQLNVFSSRVSRVAGQPLLIPRINSSPDSASYMRKAVYSRETAELVREMYEFDFLSFGYSFDL